MPTSEIEVKDQTTGYGYFQIVQSRGEFTVWQCTFHWARGMEKVHKIGTTKDEAKAFTLVRSYSGGKNLKFWGK